MKSNLIVRAPFEQNGKQYKKGDVFTIPAGYTLELDDPRNEHGDGLTFSYTAFNANGEPGKFFVTLPIEAE